MTSAEAIQRLREVARRQHKAKSTEDSYAGWLARFMVALRKMPAALSSEQKLERFLTELAFANVSASTQNQAFNAILFFYGDVLGRPLQGVDALRASRPSRVRNAPTVEDTFRLLNGVKNVGGYPTNLIARLLYGCGLRVSEPLNLRVKDVREDRIFIMGGKGRKDRVVSLPCSLANELKGQLDFSRAIWQKDVSAKIPTALPEGLARKYPEYRFALGWAWVFPAHQLCLDRAGQWVRWRCHEANVQRAIKEARRQLGIMVLPHELRHAYATHCLDRGVNIKALQEAMGHKQVETTIGYCHAEALSVKSPLSFLPMAAPPESPPPKCDQSHIAICEPSLRSEFVIELQNSHLLSSKVRGDPSQLKGRERALMEEQHTQRARAVACGFRHDEYLTSKLQPHRLLREELMAGRTPTSRRFAKLYDTKPQRALELLATAVAIRQGNPACYLNTALQVEGVRY